MRRPDLADVILFVYVVLVVRMMVRGSLIPAKLWRAVALDWQQAARIFGEAAIGAEIRSAKSLAKVSLA